MPADVSESPHLPVIAADHDHALAEIFECPPVAGLRNLADVANNLRRRTEERLLLRLEEFRVVLEPARKAHIVERVRRGLN